MDTASAPARCNANRSATQPGSARQSEARNATTGKRVAYRNLTAGIVAMHRGHKPVDAQVLAITAKRTRKAAK